MTQRQQASSARNPPVSVNRPVTTSGSARSVLLTLLAELVYPNKEPVWSASLLYMLVGMGIERQTARQAITRAANADWIEAQRHGRDVAWALTPTGDRMIEEGIDRVYSLHADPQPWDGSWLILLISIPDAQRSVRKRLYTALGWEGFGNPTPGVWLTPHLEKEAQAQSVVDELELRDAALAFAGGSVTIGQTDQEIVQQAWDLDDVTKKYEQLIVRYSGMRPASGDPLLFTHVQLCNEMQHFPFMDPQLPEELLPNWIGKRAAVMFSQLRSDWHEAAQERWREVVKETSPTGRTPD